MTPQKAGEFFSLCRSRYELTPEEVLGLLELADAKDLAAGEDYGNALDRIEQRVTLRSGRMFRPAGSWTALEAALAEAERRAFKSLRHFKFQEFGHYSELWASLAKVSGQTRKNPFGAVAALGHVLGRKQGRRGGGGSGQSAPE